MNIFERASKEKLRFGTLQGYLTVDDLWDIDIKSLDDLAMGYKKDLSERVEGSFLKSSKAKDKPLQLRFDIAKSVIESRIEALAISEKAESKRALNNKIMELIVEKENDGLKEKSIEELREMMKEV